MGIRARGLVWPVRIVDYCPDDFTRTYFFLPARSSKLPFFRSVAVIISSAASRRRLLT